MDTFSLSRLRDFQRQKTWVLSHEGFTDVIDAKGKILYRYKSCVDSFPYTIELDGRKTSVKLREKRLLTYNPKLAAKKHYEVNRKGNNPLNGSFYKVSKRSRICTEKSPEGAAGSVRAS